ncbi:phage holin family protein [Oxynema sp. CENA135]|uniref:phage holin family protein n=1 Tax=Oxynema sp. CENA135 TaxID=984206 RepID=UPI00190C5519|nr:phage holin family protein [Oxynema sp. CENA135]MBK4731039.1 phage holin family protein [Oxynema sp. CENA135]
MDWMSIIITWLVIAISLLIISKLPTGVEIDGFDRALISAAVLGALNAFLRPLLQILALPVTILTLGIFALVVNALVFGLAAYLVRGFRLRWGFWSALIGAIALTFIRSILEQLLQNFGIPGVTS